MITPEDVKARDRLRSSERTAPHVGGALVIVALAVFLILEACPLGGQEPPDSITLTVFWTPVDTFTVYDAELLRGTGDCEDGPEEVVGSRHRVGDVDASFRTDRPPPGLEWCYQGRARVSGSFDCPDGPPHGCPAPWGLSRVLLIRTPAPPPGPPDVGVDTVRFSLPTGEELGALVLRLRHDAVIVADTVVLQWYSGPDGVECGMGGGPHEACIGGRRVMRTVPAESELCARAEGCRCPPTDGNYRCGCLVVDVANSIEWDLINPQLRLRLVHPDEYRARWSQAPGSAPPGQVDGGPTPNVAYDAGGPGRGVCRAVRRVS